MISLSMEIHFKMSRARLKLLVILNPYMNCFSHMQLPIIKFNSYADLSKISRRIIINKNGCKKYTMMKLPVSLLMHVGIIDT